MTLPIIEQARLWLGTPFTAGASVRGVGCDCAGLVEGIGRDLGLAFHARRSADCDILSAASAYLVQAQTTEPGHVILLARDLGGPPLHVAIFTASNTLIHAHWRAGVVENRFGSWFAKRVTHTFAWPDLPNIQDLKP